MLRQARRISIPNDRISTAHAKGAPEAVRVSAFLIAGPYPGGLG